MSSRGEVVRTFAVLAAFTATAVSLQTLYSESDTPSRIEALLGAPSDSEGDHYQVTANYAARFVFSDDGTLVQVAVVPIDFVDESHEFDRFEDSLNRADYERVIGLLSKVKPVGKSLSVPTVIGIVTNSRYHSVEYRENAVVVRGITGDWRAWYFDVLYFHPVHDVVRECHPPSDVDSAAGYRLTIGDHTYYVREPDFLTAVPGSAATIEAAGPRLDFY